MTPSNRSMTLDKKSSQLELLTRLVHDAPKIQIVCSSGKILDLGQENAVRIHMRCVFEIGLTKQWQPIQFE